MVIATLRPESAADPIIPSENTPDAVPQLMRRATPTGRPV